MLSDLPTLALIGQRYLDTQHDAAHIANLEQELSRRGIVGPKRAVLEYLAASSSKTGRAILTTELANEGCP